MANKQHHLLDGLDMHIIHAYEYTDATERLAATGFTALDVGKVAKQIDAETWWLLTNHDPITWKDITGSGGGGLSDLCQLRDHTSMNIANRETCFYNEPVLTGTVTINGDGRMLILG